jgi:hypothetical protein
MKELFRGVGGTQEKRSVAQAKTVTKKLDAALVKFSY